MTDIWEVDLDHAYFDFVDLAWNESDHPRNPDGTFKTKGSEGTSGKPAKAKGESENKNDSSSDKPSGKSSGKGSGKARFTDKDGDGRDDRQLSDAEMKRVLSGLSPEMQDALSIYPSVLGAIKLALENGEDPGKHVQRLPSNLRAAALRAVKAVAAGSSSGGSQTPKDAMKLSSSEVTRLVAAGWAGNPNDSDEKLYPPGHPKNPKNMSGDLWAVDLDEASFDFSEDTWRQAV